MARIVETKPINLKKPILIEGFPGVGMIGTISTLYMVKELNMELVGYITSDNFPPFCVIHNGVPLPPARLYQSKKHNLVVLLSEFVIPLSEVHKVTDEVIRWSKTKKVESIISLGGIGVGGETHKLFGIATTPELRKLLAKHDIAIINEGATTGVTGVLLAEAQVHQSPAAAILTAGHGIEIDLLGAATVLDKLSRIIRVPINTDRLVKEGIEIESKIKEILKSAKTVKKKYEQIEESPMYR
jgi:uncharacterized protein